jgi:transcriptional regulator with XRE-family HTH domain
MKELKNRIRKSGIDRREIAKRCGIKYGTLSGYLNDFIDMPDHIRQEIEGILREEEG